MVKIVNQIKLSSKVTIKSMVKIIVDRTEPGAQKSPRIRWPASHRIFPPSRGRRPLLPFPPVSPPNPTPPWRSHPARRARSSPASPAPHGHTCPSPPPRPPPPPPRSVSPPAAAARAPSPSVPPPLQVRGQHRCSSVRSRVVIERKDFD